jgi:hypothetical protein
MTKSNKIRRFRRWLRSAAGQKATHLAPVVAVALVALYVSYGHIRHVALAHGYGEIGADLLPLSVDGMVIAAARYITRARNAVGRACAVGAFVLGILATLAGNLLASQHDIIGRGTAVWPAIAVVGTGAVLHWGEARPKRKRQPAAKSTTRRTAKTATR